MDEARKTGRVKRAFLVRYRTPGVSSGRVWSTSPLRDFSGTGVRFLAEHPFEAGQRMTLQLLLPMAREPVEVAARVAWAKPTMSGLVELGVAFEAEQEERARRLIHDAAAFFLRKAAS
jgi:hypothetical protein